MCGTVQPSPRIGYCDFWRGLTSAWCLTRAWGSLPNNLNSGPSGQPILGPLAKSECCGGGRRQVPFLSPHGALLVDQLGSCIPHTPASVTAGMFKHLTSHCSFWGLFSSYCNLRLSLPRATPTPIITGKQPGDQSL